MRLNVSSEATTKLHEEKKRAEEERLKKLVAEADALQQKRKAKQEQQLAIRAGKRADYVMAKEAERILEHSCEDLETALDGVGSKANIKAVEDELARLVKKLKGSSKRYYKAKAEMDEAEIKIAQARGKLGELQAATDGSIVELKSQRLREAWDNSQRAWERIQKAIRKRLPPEGRDRALKKRAKGLLS